MRMWKPSRLVVLFALFLATTVAAQQAATIRGRVTIASDNSPLPGATVSIDELNLSTVTDAQGSDTLNVPASQVHGQAVKLTVMLQGFQSRTFNMQLNGGDTTRDAAMRVAFGQEITVGSRAVGAEQEKAVPVDII